MLHRYDFIFHAMKQRMQFPHFPRSTDGAFGGPCSRPVPGCKGGRRFPEATLYRFGLADYAVNQCAHSGFVRWAPPVVGSAETDRLNMFGIVLRIDHHYPRRRVRLCMYSCSGQRRRQLPLTGPPGRVGTRVITKKRFGPLQAVANRLGNAFEVVCLTGAWALYVSLQVTTFLPAPTMMQAPRCY